MGAKSPQKNYKFHSYLSSVIVLERYHFVKAFIDLCVDWQLENHFKAFPSEKNI